MTRVAALLVLVLLAAPAPAAAFNVNDWTWSDSTIPWYLHPSGSEDVTFSQLKGALDAAFQEFQKLSCFPKSFSYGGTKSTNPKNGIYIQFKESSWDPTVGDAAAYAQTWTTWGGSADYSVMVFNGKDLTWTTTQANDFYSLKSDIQGVATHELGHCLGLAHSRVREATMFFSGGSAELRSLDQDDKNAICYLYSSFSQGQPCDACSADNDCASGYCLQYPDGKHYCGRDCTSDSQCPENFYCYDLEDFTDQCAATNGYCSQDGANIPVGYFCYGHETCEDGMCMAVPDDAYCSKECTSDSQCPGWMKCIADLCLIGGSTPMGGSCASHMDCASGMCLKVSELAAVCTVTCVAQSDCPDGFGCFSGYCLAGGDSPYGAACESDTECETGECFNVGNNQKICTKVCESSADCPGQDPCPQSICIPAGSAGFGDPCTANLDCQSGYCAGYSDKFCTKACDNDAGCPDQAYCAGGGYCVPQKTPDDQCFDDSDCSAVQLCLQESQGAAGTCVKECDPFADTGCAAQDVCRWHKVAWQTQVTGVCVPATSGGEEGEPCQPVDDPCRLDLYCANVGGNGLHCFRDCNVDTGAACAATEACLPLGIGSDPLHGVCVCNDPSCQPGGEDTGVPPQPDVVSAEDLTIPLPGPDATTEEPEPDTAAPAADTGSNNSGGHSGNGGSTGGCTATGTPVAAWPFLLLLFALTLRRRKHAE